MKQNADQAVFISEQKEEVEKLKKQLVDRDKRVAAIRQELKLEADVAKLHEQPRPHNGAVGADSAEVRRSREHLCTQIPNGILEVMIARQGERKCRD